MASPPVTTNKMDYRDLRVFQLHTLQGLTKKQTAEKLGISTDTIKRIKRKDSYNRMAQLTLESKGYAIDSYVEDLISLSKAQRWVSLDGGVTRNQEPDNPTRIAAIKELGGIFGSHAPKDINVEHGFASASDDELFGELLAMAREFSVVAESSGDAGDAPDDPESLEGTVLPVRALPEPI